MTQNLHDTKSFVTAKREEPVLGWPLMQKFPSFSFDRVSYSLLTYKRHIYSNTISFRLNYKKVRPVRDLFSPVCKHLLT